MSSTFEQPCSLAQATRGRPHQLYFNNGDGVPAIVKDQNAQLDNRKDKTQSSWHYLRLLLTDSGHYLLPLDDARPVSHDTTDNIDQLYYAWSADISEKWKDVRHCFLQGKASPRHRERERYHHAQDEEKKSEEEASSSSKTFSSTTSPEEVPPEAREGKSSSATATTSSTTSSTATKDSLQPESVS